MRAKISLRLHSPKKFERFTFTVLRGLADLIEIFSVATSGEKWPCCEGAVTLYCF